MSVTFSSVVDAASAEQVLPVVAQAASELDFQCAEPLVVIHADLASYEAASGAPWYLLAAANVSSCTIDTQRIAILEQNGGVRATLRHELFHLAQPPGLARWEAEGLAQRFAGEVPAARAYTHASVGALEGMLADPPGREVYLRALATAWMWTTPAD